MVSFLFKLKIVNNTKKAEAIIGKSKYEDVEALFGTYYEQEIEDSYENRTLTYYPDFDSNGIIDIMDANTEYALHLSFDEANKILEPYEFFYYTAMK